jgi:hypothetical protein
MTDATKPLLIVGSPDAAACEGDFCEIPEHHTQAQVNRQLDADLV